MPAGLDQSRSGAPEPSFACGLRGGLWESVRVFGLGRCLPRDGLWESVRVFGLGRCLPRDGLWESVRVFGSG